LFRLGLLVKLLVVVLLIPVNQQDWFLPFIAHFFESPSLTPWGDFLEKGGTYLAFPYGPVMLIFYLPMSFFGWLLDHFFSVNYFLGLGFRFSLLTADLFVLLFLLQCPPDQFLPRKTICKMGTKPRAAKFKFQ